MDTVDTLTVRKQKLEDSCKQENRENLIPNSINFDSSMYVIRIINVESNKGSGHIENIIKQGNNLYYKILVGKYLGKST